jgi:hypothetical protein
MDSILRLAASVVGTLSLMATVFAADLSGDDIRKLISGKSVYLELTSASVAAAGQGVIYYDPAGTALYKTAKGELWQGTWTIKDNTACVDWKQSANNACTRYDKQGDTINLVNVATGQTRGKVLKTADGNAEKLGP